MIFGTGVDIVEVYRMRDAVKGRVHLHHPELARVVAQVVPLRRPRRTDHRRAVGPQPSPSGPQRRWAWHFRLVNCIAGAA